MAEKKKNEWAEKLAYAPKNLGFTYAYTIDDFGPFGAKSISEIACNRIAIM